MTTAVTPADTASTPFLDAASPAVQDFALRAAAGASSEPDRVSRVFAAVRDGLRYDPYSLSMDQADYVASSIANRPAGYCIPKAILLVAACRALGIPARIGFADVRNHLQSEKLLEAMGTDLFRFHGYAAVFVEGSWAKASPAFNRELCDRFGVAALDFDGRQDALLHPFSGDGSRYMEYVTDHGTFDDVPFETICAVFRETYPGLTVGAGTADDPAFS